MASEVGWSVRDMPELDSLTPAADWGGVGGVGGATARDQWATPQMYHGNLRGKVMKALPHILPVLKGPHRFVVWFDSKFELFQLDKLGESASGKGRRGMESTRRQRGTPCHRWPALRPIFARLPRTTTSSYVFRRFVRPATAPPRHTPPPHSLHR